VTATLPKTCPHCASVFTPTRKNKYHCSLPCRFWAKVDIRGADECWPWVGARHGKGYGHVRVGGKIQKAARVALTLSGQPANLGDVQACHACDNPPCCNPKHLFWGTPGDNSRDRTAKGRQFIPDNRGSRHGMSKLDEAKVRDIRSSNEDDQTLAIRYGVSAAQIYNVKRGHSWKSVS
jgi:hypothetical protein